MDNENIVSLDTTNEPVQETELEIVETPVTEAEEVVAETTPEVDVDALQATNKKLFERAKKAEAELKALRPKVVAKPAQAPSPTASVEETVLLAQGMSEELLGELKAIAQVRKTSLIKAQTDFLFVAAKEKFEKEQKSKDASLGASRSSGSVKAKKTPNTPGLTREEHYALIKS
jgi:hypothetical protein